MISARLKDVVGARRSIHGLNDKSAVLTHKTLLHDAREFHNYYFIIFTRASMRFISL